MLMVYTVQPKVIGRRKRTSYSQMQSGKIKVRIGRKLQRLYLAELTFSAYTGGRKF